MSKTLADKVANGAIGVFPTDTIYGIIGSAMDKDVYTKIAKAKSRDINKKFVIIVANWQQIQDLGVVLSEEQKSVLTNIWPGPTTAILGAPKAHSYLLGPDNTIAVRLPSESKIKSLAENAGPVIATSVNIHKKPFLNSLNQIKPQFPDLDFYVFGEVPDTPSEIIRISEDGSTSKIR